MKDDFKLFWGYDLRLMDKLTDGQTFVIVESLSRLKNMKDLPSRICLEKQCRTVAETASDLYHMYRRHASPG